LGLEGLQLRFQVVHFGLQGPCPLRVPRDHLMDQCGRRLGSRRKAAALLMRFPSLLVLFEPLLALRRTGKPMRAAFMSGHWPMHAFVWIHATRAVRAVMTRLRPMHALLRSQRARALVAAMVLVVMMAMVVMGELAIPAVVMSAGLPIMVAVVVMMMGELAIRAVVMSVELPAVTAIVVMMMGELAIPAIVMFTGLSIVVAMMVMVVMMMGELAVPVVVMLTGLLALPAMVCELPAVVPRHWAGKAMGPGHLAP
jgi:hypothetical protein